jgi:ankyrin repeat protein
VSIASKLLAEGASGILLHEALIYAVKTNHTEAIEILVRRNEPNKASVDYNDAVALRDAVSREKTHLVKLLLSGGPSKASVGKGFPSIWNCTKDGRFAWRESCWITKPRVIR